MSSPAVHGVDASPYSHAARSGILTPSSEGSINRHDGVSASSSQPHRAIRTSSLAMDHLLKPPIMVKSHPPNLNVQPRALHPLMLLPRKHLPLSSFDLATPQGDLPRSRFYESHVKILELESRLGSASSVLIARNDAKGTVFAVERQENGLFVICKLGSWVDLVQLAGHATVICEERVRPVTVAPMLSIPAPSALTTPQIRKNEKVKNTAIEAIQSLVRKRARSQSVANTNEPTTTDNSSEANQANGALPSPQISIAEGSMPVPSRTPPTAVVAGEVTSPQRTAEALFDNIRSLYFEALYKSKGSLAYFAKGPLSRARSTFHLDLESNLDISDLIDFLRALILTTVQIDKKYREAVPELILQTKAVEDSSDEARKRRRKPKKMRLNKDGLYPLEDEVIRKWWLSNKPELKADELTISKQVVNSHVSLLRSRETQLQMILIMEILALETLKDPSTAPDSSLPALPGSAGIAGADMAPPPPPVKKRSKHNLPMLIDVHADRLTIWQSTATDDLFLLEDSQASSASASVSTDPKSTSEPLKDFCIDVILPFYSARLPNLSETLNNKLGGPVAMAPRKPKSLKSLSDKKDKEQRPGAAAKRVAQRREPRTLERALSFDQENRRSMSRGPRSALALMRPAASMTLPGIKREDSDSVVLPTSSSNADDGSSSSRANSLVRSSSMADLRDLKAAKKAKVEAELKDAISTLRKPNREYVSKAVVEAAEKRASASSSLKGRKPSRLATIPHIQVEATPANKRFRNVLDSRVEASPDVPLPSTEEIIPPSSIGANVPSTIAKKRRYPGSEVVNSPALDAVGCTPIRTSTSSNFLRRAAMEEPMIPPSSPLMSRKASFQSSSTAAVTSVFATPAKRSLFTPHNSGGALLETPIKRPALLSFSKQSDSASQAEKENNPSIYEQLGWDDDLYGLS